MLNLKKYFILLFVIFIVSCAENKKIPISGADVTSDNNTNKNLNSSDESKISVSDIDSKDKTIEEVLVEELVEVGDRVFFGYDSSDLDSDALELLQDQVAWLKQNSNVSVTIEGHCDERGTREYNLALGEKRAQAVKNYLIGLGISPDRVSTVSYGKERPAVVGSNDGAWAQNRRSVTLVN